MQRAHTRFRGIWLWALAYALVLLAPAYGFVHAWFVSMIAPSPLSPTGAEVPTTYESTFTVTTLPLHVTALFWVLFAMPYVAPLLAGIAWARDPAPRRRNVLLPLFLALLALVVSYMQGWW